MADLTVTQVTRAGIPGTLVAAAGGGDKFSNTGMEWFRINNGGVGSINVTFVTQTTVDGLAVADLVVAVPAGESRLVGPFPPGVYNDDDDKVNVTYSGVTSVTVNPFRLVPEPV